VQFSGGGVSTDRSTSSGVNYGRATITLGEFGTSWDVVRSVAAKDFPTSGVDFFSPGNDCVLTRVSANVNSSECSRYAPIIYAGPCSGREKGSKRASYVVKAEECEKGVANSPGVIEKLVWIFVDRLATIMSSKF
jgi:hypothetical protein